MANASTFLLKTINFMGNNPVVSETNAGKKKKIDVADEIPFTVKSEAYSYIYILSLPFHQLRCRNTMYPE